MKRTLVLLLMCLSPLPLNAGTKTWDGKYDTSRIDVTVVYFVPSDRSPLIDWKDRVSYFCRRIEQFHAREFGTQSVMKTQIHSEPLISESSTAELRQGDANRIYFRTLSETDRRLKFAAERGDAFPILLVLSEINWRPLDDFYRLQPTDDGLQFEGNYNNRQHFPGAAAGGARAAYLADRGVGWGLVSADGWRVPYRGSDCVIYHEGCGHTVGLPHPEPGNNSVMSLGQYNGWISESWLDKDQKIRMAWTPENSPNDRQTQLFTEFTAIPDPLVPAPGQPVSLKLTWPDLKDTALKSIRVRCQTAVRGPWTDSATPTGKDLPAAVAVGTFDRETPVSYRIDVMLESGETAELWGYFQVRTDPEIAIQPIDLSTDLITHAAASANAPVERWPENETDLLAKISITDNWTTGTWERSGSTVLSPKGYGMRLQLPFSPPDEYRLTAIVEPLDVPNGLLFGHVSRGHRFVTLFSYALQDSVVSAIENIDGRNVGNESTFTGAVLKQHQLSQVVVTVRASGVTMSVDGYTIVNWKGDVSRLSLSDYWSTPDDTAMFLGAYDCRYRFYRLTLRPLKE
ncbi:MAG: hypothetical protein R3C49_09115 [Planctomycetaceae bacterium]